MVLAIVDTLRSKYTDSVTDPEKKKCNQDDYLWNVRNMLPSFFYEIQYYELYKPAVSQALQVQVWGTWPGGRQWEI